MYQAQYRVFCGVILGDHMPSVMHNTLPAVVCVYVCECVCMCVCVRARVCVRAFVCVRL